MEKKETLKQLLLEEINKTQGYISKGQLHLFAENQGYSPEGAGRELRKLAKEGKVLVDYYTGKRKQQLARYARLGEQPPIPQKPQYRIEERNGFTVAVLVS